jgi:hypothetical protein
VLNGRAASLVAGQPASIRLLNGILTAVRRRKKITIASSDETNNVRNLSQISFTSTDPGIYISEIRLAAH